MLKNTLAVAVICCLFLIGLQCFGYAFPSSLNWGFHYLGFLPPYGIAVYLLLALALLGLCIFKREIIHHLLQRTAGFMEHSPHIFLAVVCTAFAISAFLLRIKAPLLGDSFILINNYEFTYNGTHELYLHRSPFSFGYFYLFSSVMNTPTYPAILDAFLAGEILLGIGFIVSAFYIARNLFEQPAEQLLSFCIALALPYMQLFFGYVELYGVVLFSLSLFILVSILYLKNRVPFYAVPPVYLLLYSSNYLNIIVIPALLYLMYIEFKRGKRWTVPFGILLCGVIVFAVFAMMNFEVHRFFMAAEHRHWLTLSESSGDEFQAYTMFSVFHALDLLNWIVLLPAGALLFIGMALLNDKKLPAFDESLIFLFSCFFLFVGFVAVVKFDLGFPKDWDVPSPYVFPLYLFALVLFFRSGISEKIIPAALVLGILSLTSLPWFVLNAKQDSTLERMKMLVDKRITSPSGVYQSLFHISMFYYHNRMVPEQIGVWEDFVEMFPNDLRGYENLTKSYYEGGEQYDKKTIAVFERWIAIDTLRNTARNRYANFLAESGLTQYRRKNIVQAQQMLQKAILLEPQLMAAYNNLATMYLDKQQPDSAIALCKNALSVNPTYIPAYQNLATAYARKKEFELAIAIYKQVLAFDPANITAYENMSKAYYQTGNKQQAMETLRIAARLGSATAQQLLRMSGERW